MPDIVMETCVVESQKMYLSTPKSISYRNHVLREIELGKFVGIIFQSRSDLLFLNDNN